MTRERWPERARLTLQGRDYVVIARNEFDRLIALAKAASLPPLPERDERGNYPAVSYARTSIARTIVRERTRLGLTQAELARQAGMRVETLCRIEKGRCTASTATVAKLEHALHRAAAKSATRGTRRMG